MKQKIDKDDSIIVRGYYRNEKPYSPVVSVFTSYPSVGGTKIKHYSALSRISSISEARLIEFMAVHMEADDNSLYLYPALRKKARKFLGVSDNTVSIILRSLKEAGLLHKQSDGMFHINPYFYWKGSYRAREKFLKRNKEWIESTFGISFSIFPDVNDKEVKESKKQIKPLYSTKNV